MAKLCHNELVVRMWLGCYSAWGFKDKGTITWRWNWDMSMHIKASVSTEISVSPTGGSWDCEGNVNVILHEICSTCIKIIIITKTTLRHKKNKEKKKAKKCHLLPNKFHSAFVNLKSQVVCKVKGLHSQNEECKCFILIIQWKIYAMFRITLRCKSSNSLPFMSLKSFSACLFLIICQKQPHSATSDLKYGFSSFLFFHSAITFTHTLSTE